MIKKHLLLKNCEKKPNVLVFILHSYEQFNKRKQMNNLKKIGLSALAGSLAMVSAHAVEYTVTGDLLASFSTANSPTGPETENGKGFGADTDLYFTSSGELDNGYTVGYVMSINTNGALTNSSSQLTMGMGSLGTLQMNHVGGSKANAIDDVMPAAYQETWDGLTASASNGSFFGNRVNSGSIDYRIPAQSLMGTTINASVTYDPNASDAAATSATGGANDNRGTGNSGYTGTAYTLQIAHESGVEIGGGIEQIGDDSGLTTGQDSTEQTTGYIKYAMGPVSVGYQESYSNKRHGAGVVGRDQESSMAAIAYTSGNTTVSYGESDLENHQQGATAAVTTELQSIQVSYVMGAMTLSAAMSETDNASGILAKKYEENTLAVSFAF